MSTEKIQSIPIEVSSRILRHISRGIYRSPAGALKELVSNAYDAGAKKVTINTGYPVIEKIIVIDNGKGMSSEKFKQIISQIGFSEKNLGEEIEVINSSEKTKRKTIGHYGIGFLAIGQLSKKAVITSKTIGTIKGIRATMDFEQFETHNVNGRIRSKATDESILESKDKSKKNKEDASFNIGICYLQDVEFDKSDKEVSFTKVELFEIREDVQKQISGTGTNRLSPEAEQQRSYSASFEDILKLLRIKESQSAAQKIENKKVPRLREYFYEMLLWELSVYSPLHYPSSKEFKKNGDLYFFSTLANKSEFELTVDGFILSKPFEEWFWEEKNSFSYKIYKWENEVYYNNYKTSAYLIFQPGTMIRPKSLQGCLIRENLVAVGLYDTTFLNYPFNEGNKFNSLTGEIYATGLSGAMNVDRDSFNQTAEEYVALTDWFHEKLYKEVFPDIKKFQQTKESPSRKKSSALVSEVLFEMVGVGKKIKDIKFKGLGKKEKRRIKVEKNTLIINTDHKDCDMSTAKREKLLLASALIINGYVSPDQYELVSDEIEKTKKNLKENG